MDYRILLPVTSNPDRVEQKLREIPDLTKLILVNNYDSPPVAELANGAHRDGATVYQCPFNLGLAAAWNIGLAEMEHKPEIGLVMVLSPSVVFDLPVKEVLDYLFFSESERPGWACRYIPSTRASLHCFATTRQGLALGGYFDENFYPIYWEDTDYCQRSKYNGVGARVAVNGFSESCHSLALGVSLQEKRIFQLWEANMGRVTAYYAAKWGGPQFDERFDHPFNTPGSLINEWTVNTPFDNTLIGNPNWHLPTMAERKPL